MHSRDDILAHYFLYLLNRGDADLYERVEEVDDLVADDPVAGWSIVQDLIACAPSEEALAYLAAGALENLLVLHGDLIAPDIHRVAVQDPRVQDALGHVFLWEKRTPKVDALLGEWLCPEPGSDG
jgi:Family of unknown function (DUF6869)